MHLLVLYHTLLYLYARYITFGCYNELVDIASRDLLSAPLHLGLEQITLCLHFNVLGTNRGSTDTSQKYSHEQSKTSQNKKYSKGSLIYRDLDRVYTVRYVRYFTLMRAILTALLQEGKEQAYHMVYWPLFVACGQCLLICSLGYHLLNRWLGLGLAGGTNWA